MAKSFARYLSIALLMLAGGIGARRQEHQYASFRVFPSALLKYNFRDEDRIIRPTLASNCRTPNRAYTLA
jgi:hypothetical protein